MNNNGLISVARYYMPSLRPFLIIFPTASIAVAIISYLLSYTAIGFLFSSMLALIVSAMLCFGPLALTRRSDRVLETMLPATNFDKWAFIVIWSFIIVPILTLGLNTLIGKILSAIFGVAPFMHDAISRVAQYSQWYWPVVQYLQSLIPVATCMVCVVSLRHNRVGMSIVWTIVTLIVLAVAGMAYGIWLAFSQGFEDAAAGLAPDPEGLANEITARLSSMFWLLGVGALCYEIFMAWLAYRKISRFQF